MGWKNWSYFLKGGIIFLIITAILFLYGIFGGSDIICIPENCGGERLPLADFAREIVDFLLIPLSPIMLLISSFIKKYNVIVNIFSLVIIILYFFGVGSLIGWIYGKIKLRNKIKGLI